MLSPHETAYPRLKNTISTRDLEQIYTPTASDLAFVEQVAIPASSRLCFVVLLKVCQRLGYFIPLAEVPAVIVQHIARHLGYLLALPDLAAYDHSGSRRRQIPLIRSYLGIKAFDRMAQTVMMKAMEETARVREDAADVVNVAIERLIAERYELPGFTTLTRTAYHLRAQVNHGYFRHIHQSLTELERQSIDRLLQVDPETKRSLWNRLKQDPGRPTLTQLKELVAHLTWLKTHEVGTQAVAALPDIKQRQFAAEAQSLDAGRMAALEVHKRSTLAAVLIHRQLAATLDDLGEMFVKRMQKIHQAGETALALYRQDHQEITDELVSTLASLLTALQSETAGPVQRLESVERCLGDRQEDLLHNCQAYLAHTRNNYFPFLWNHYASHRPTLFALLDHLTLQSTSQDQTVEQAIDFLRRHRTSRSDQLSVSSIQREPDARLKLVATLDLTWIPDKWWKLVTGQSTRDKLPAEVNRRFFELCVFSQVMQELKSGDLCIPGSDQFSDFRGQFISWEEYEQSLSGYQQQLGFPTKSEGFCQHLKAWLDDTARRTDTAFPQNDPFQIVNGEPLLKRPERQPVPDQLTPLKLLIAERMPSINILDVLADTENWLHWTRFFGPLSGHDTKLDQPRERYLTTVFAYGCYLGPAQTARALSVFDRRQLAWINQRHITEANLYEATVAVINAYNQFLLPKLWGTGRHASADGMKWDMYENNLLAEYHIRYGGYGGIGYYHVSDTYIALFSHFIPCGVWEAVYILDGLLNNTSDVQPDTIHADTQGQSTPVFGLAYLLGIKLMPRIRNWKDLTFFKPYSTARYPHTEALYSDNIDWELIQTHFPDMLRLVLSIQAGRVSASTILRKLGTASRKNRLYLAFRELGRAVRTAFLLTYLSDSDLRRTIQSATNKSEAFNRFVQWVAFGNNGLITENTRDEQRKIIKYNQLVANCLILHNVFTLTGVLQQLLTEGISIDREVMARLSPYLTEHINRFGHYTLNLDRPTPPLGDKLHSRLAQP